MGILDVINTLILVVGITFGLMMVCNTLIRVSSEEYRKNEKFAMELLDKSFDKLTKAIIDCYKEINHLETEKKNKEYESWAKTENS